MEPDQIDFRDVADNATRSVLVRLYAYIGKLLRAVNALAPPVPGVWQDVATGAGFQNGWSNFGAAYYPAAFRVDSDGTVRLRGLITGGALGTVALTLPPAFRPTRALLFPAGLGGVTTGTMQVDAAGGVTPTGANNAYATLDGITFALT